MKKFFLLLLLFLIGYYLIKAFVRLLKIFVEKKEPGFQSNSASGSNNIHFENPSDKKKRFDKDEGDYIDFEEVK